MKQFILSALVILMIFSSHQLSGQNNFVDYQKKIEMNMEKEKTAIEKLLFTYRDALNDSNVEKALSLYSLDGVFMPSGAPTSVGQEQVKGAYEFVFSNIQLNIEFFIDEIEIAGHMAFARTTSKGTTLIHASGETVPEENRELFVLQKENGSWKIARYMFNKMK